MTEAIALERIREFMFVFHELTTVDELRQASRLRFDVYASAAVGFTGRSLDRATGLDMDAFDLFSRHYGLFARREADEELVGTLRISGDSASPFADMLWEVARGHGSLVARLSASRPAPIPMMANLGKCDAFRSILRACTSGGEVIAEPGRLVVDPQLRTLAARAGIRLSHFVVQNALAVGWQGLKLSRVFLDCHPGLEAFYRDFGFQRVLEVPLVDSPEVGWPLIVMTSSPADVPSRLQGEVDSLAAQLSAQGHSVLAPANRQGHISAACTAVAA